jgi:Cu/Ag efflux protein CusF
MKTILLLALLCQQAPPPKPAFQGDYFGEMARAFCVIQKVDADARTVTAKLDRDGKLVTVPIKDDTELHVRDSWGELSDYSPGQHVMLFMYVDDDKKWTYPRAIQDDIHMRARHGHFARVVKIDREARTYATQRDEKDGKGNVTKTVDDAYACAAEVKVWKGATPAGLEALKEGDEVVTQLVERDGKLVAWEILDKAGDDAVRAAQDERHRKDQDEKGLPSYVTDVEVLNGSLQATVAWSGSDRAKKELKVGAAVTIVPDGGKAFAGAVCSVQGVDSRQRVQFAINSRVAARLAPGESLRIFVPGTGPAVPEGRAGLPAPKK